MEELDADIISHVKMLVESYPEIDEWDLHNETPGIRGHKPEMGVRRWVEWAGGPVLQRNALSRRCVKFDRRAVIF